MSSNEIVAKKLSMVLELVFRNNTKDMAKTLDTTTMTIRQWTFGLARPSFTLLSKIRALGINIEWLFDDTDRSLNGMIRNDSVGENLRATINRNIAEHNIPLLSDTLVG